MQRSQWSPHVGLHMLSEVPDLMPWNSWSLDVAMHSKLVLENHEMSKFWESTEGKQHYHFYAAYYLSKV